MSRRTVSSCVELQLHGATRMIFAIAAAEGSPIQHERIAFEVDGEPVPFRETTDLHGTRLQLFDVDGDVRVVGRYDAELLGRSPERIPTTERDLITYLRPSRYCEADALAPRARAEFGGLVGVELIDAISEWVHAHLDYVVGSGSPTDGALATLAAGHGVCRDFAHVVIAFCRALDVPARLVSVYAPGLRPPDFHAVAEVWSEDRWVVVDATRLAPREGLIRIATGRDAADTAWLTSLGVDVDFVSMQVRAEADELPADDHLTTVELG